MIQIQVDLNTKLNSFSSCEACNEQEKRKWLKDTKANCTETCKQYLFGKLCEIYQNFILTKFVIVIITFNIKNSLPIFKNVEQKLFRSFRLRKNDFLNPLDVSEIYEQELMKKSCVIKEA